MSYFIVWEFAARKGRERKFERLYGCRGEWAKLFARSPGYQGTDLLRGKRKRRWYVTIDRWVSRGAYERFQAKFREEYAQTDAKGEGLTVKERKVGEFEGLCG